MICQNCVEFSFINELEHYFVTSNLSEPLNYFSDYATENDGEVSNCNNCGSIILIGDLYLKEDDDIELIKEATFTAFAEEIMTHIESCEECGHGEFMQGLQHSIYSIFNEPGDNPDKIYDNFHYATELVELIYNIIGFDENYYEDILNYISCPHCKNGSGPDFTDKIDYGKFSVYDTVYTKEDIKEFESKFYGESYREITKEIERIAQICSYDDLVCLRNEFIKNPYTISQNAIFKDIYNFIENLYYDDDCLILYKSKRLYRARSNKNNSLYTADEMWGPSLENIRQNRYNASGFHVLYCSNDRKALTLEVPNIGLLGYTIATLRLLRPFKVFKINPAFGYEFQGIIEEPVPSDNENLEFKIQYIITNIISSISKQVGFDGIAYLSVKDTSYINYAFFDYVKNKEIEIISIDDH